MNTLNPEPELTLAEQIKQMEEEEQEYLRKRNLKKELMKEQLRQQEEEKKQQEFLNQEENEKKIFYFTFEEPYENEEGEEIEYTKEEIKIFEEAEIKRTIKGIEKEYNFNSACNVYEYIKALEKRVKFLETTPITAPTKKRMKRPSTTTAPPILGNFGMCEGYTYCRPTSSFIPCKKNSITCLGLCKIHNKEFKTQGGYINQGFKNITGYYANPFRKTEIHKYPNNTGEIVNNIKNPMLLKWLRQPINKYNSMPTKAHRAIMEKENYFTPKEIEEIEEEELKPIKDPNEITNNFL